MAVELEPKYYLAHFESLLAHVEEQYAGLWTEKEAGFVEAFRALSEDARALFVRMNNRRGELFRLDRLAYPELDACAINELLAEGFVFSLGSDNVDALIELTSRFNLREWRSVLETLRVTLPKRAKRDVVWAAVIDAPARRVLPLLLERWPVVRLAHVETVEALMFMFFGSLRGHLSEFVVRDVGHVRLEHYDVARLTPRFANRHALDECLDVARAARELSVRGETEPPDAVFAWLLEWACARGPLGPAARSTLDRMFVRVGRALEREKLDPIALHAYKLASAPPARERRARVHYRLKESAAALAVCEEIRQSPRCAEERLFAEDFSDRILRKRRRKRTTETLRSAELLRVELLPGEAVESAVVRRFVSDGLGAVHVENRLWRALFGLLLWEVLFDEEACALHHPLQRGPSDLREQGFFERRREAIERALKTFEGDDGARRLARRIEDKRGTTNPMVTWDDALLAVVKVAFDRLPFPALRAVLTEMARDLGNGSTGFPDLFVWGEEQYELVEVKSENDALSVQQLHWLGTFRRLAIPARVLRVERANYAVPRSSKTETRGS